MQTNYSDTVTSSRSAARDILRVEKVSDLHGFITNQKAKITDLETRREEIVTRQNKEIEESEKEVARMVHMLSVAESTNDPDIEDVKEACEQEKTRHTDLLEEVEIPYKQELEDFDAGAKIVTKAVDAKLAEYAERIENWNTGKSKVSRERMVALASKLAANRIGEAFNQGAYDTAETEVETAEEVDARS